MKKLILILLFIPAILFSQAVTYQRIGADTIRANNRTNKVVNFQDTLKFAVPLDSAYYKFTKFHTQPIYTVLGLQDSLNTRFRRGDTSWLHSSGTYTGFLSNIDWTIFNNKQNALSFPLDTSLTQSKVRKLIAGFGVTLNPISGIGDVTVTADTSASGGVPSTRTLTISANSPLSSSAGAQNLSTNRTWTLSADTSTSITGLTTLYQNSLKKDKTDSTASTGYARNWQLSNDTTILRAQFLKNADSSLFKFKWDSTGSESWTPQWKLGKYALYSDTASMLSPYLRTSLLALDTTISPASWSSSTLRLPFQRMAWTDKANTFGLLQTLTGGASVGNVNHGGNGIFIGASFRTGTEQLYLHVSNDGKTFNLISPTSLYTPYSGLLRDPSLLYYNNKYYVAFTTKFASGNKEFEIISSPDLVNWDSLTVVNVLPSAVSKHVWAPEWFVDTDGSVGIFVSAGDAADTQMRIYYVAASNTALTSWGTADSISGTDLPVNMIDGFTTKIGSTYYLFYKNENTKYTEMLSSSSKTSGYTVTHSGDWAGWGNALEAPSIVQIDTIKWAVYLDDYTNHVIYYSTSSDGFATWTAKTPITTQLSNPQAFNVFRLRDISSLRNILSTINSNGALWKSDGVGSSYLTGAANISTTLALGGATLDSAFTNPYGTHTRGLKVDANASIGGTLSTTGAINDNTTLASTASPTFNLLTLSNLNVLGGGLVNVSYSAGGGAGSPVEDAILTYATLGAGLFANNRYASNYGTGLVLKTVTTGNTVNNTLTLNPDNSAVFGAGLTLNGSLSMGTNAISSVGAITASGLSSFDANAGTATIGAGDSVQVTINNLSIATGTGVVSYFRGLTSTVTADTIATCKVNTAGKLTIFGKFGWSVAYFVGKQ